MIDRVEPRNALLYANASSVFARVVGPYFLSKILIRIIFDLDPLPSMSFILIED